jgi:4-hydroxybutyrate CoA-transferase
MDWKEEYRRKLVSLEEMAKQIKSGDTIGTAMAISMCSPDVYNAILDRAGELRDVTILDAVPVRPCKLYDPKFMATIDGHINYLSAFFSPGARAQGQPNNADFLIVMSADIGDKFANRSDVYATMVTPPNKQGYVNLGLTHFYTHDAIRKGRKSGKLRLAIGEVNDQMPTVLGDNWMHVSEFDLFVENSTKIPAVTRKPPGEVEAKVAKHVLELINDGDTIQMGIGGIPEAVIAGLEGRHDLGVHTEMFPVGLQDLVPKGVVTNARKPFHRGKTIATFCMGDQALYDFINENPNCELHPASYTNNPSFIAQHPNIVAINMALLIDFSGNIASEGMGYRMISGTGGQLDFMIGSYYSPGGKGITLISSARKLKDGTLASSIVPELPPFTPVTVPRTFTQYVVTEYGIADLRFKTVRERAEALINIAHPDLRGELRDSLKKKLYMKK